jgi:predicted Zn-dependent protease
MKKPIAASIGFLLGASLASAANAFDLGSLAGKLGQVQQYAQTGLQVFESARKGIEDLTPEEEYYIGRSVAAKILGQYQPAKHNQIHAYIAQLGEYLAGFSDRPETWSGYHFQLIRSNEINAFAAPGGFIMITTGLYKSLKTEEQLAAVLAHEISHVTLQHGLGAIQTSNLTQAFTLIGQTALQESGKGQELANLNQLTGVFSTSIDDIINELVVSGYSRDQELNADAEALKILYLAGYNPSGLTEFLETLHSRSGTSGHAGFYDTHPPAGDRLNAARKEIADNGWSGSTSSKRNARFQKHRL